VNVPAKFEVRSFTHSCDITGVLKDFRHSNPGRRFETIAGLIIHFDCGAIVQYGLVLEFVCFLLHFIKEKVQLLL